MWGGPKGVDCQWPCNATSAEVSVPNTLLLSPAAASHVPIYPAGTIAGAVAREAFSTDGFIIFL